MLYKYVDTLQCLTHLTVLLVEAVCHLQQGCTSELSILQSNNLVQLPAHGDTFLLRMLLSIVQISPVHTHQSQPNQSDLHPDTYSTIILRSCTY